MTVDDVGGRLRSARESRGLSLRDVAKRTKLSIAILQAIERNDFANLPRGMFRKAYVRALAAEVGLDPNEIAAAYGDRFEPPIETPAVPDRESIAEEKRLEQLTPSPRRSIVTVAIMSAGAAAWFMLQARPVVTPRAALTEAASIVATPDAAPIAIVATTDMPLRIELAAAGPCWVAADSDGERVMYRLVEPGERLVLEGQHIISVRVGDAGAVTLSINGGPKRSLGRDGEVAELTVTPDNVESLRRSSLEAVSDTG